MPENGMTKIRPFSPLATGWTLGQKRSNLSGKIKFLNPSKRKIIYYLIFNKTFYVHLKKVKLCEVD